MNTSQFQQATPEQLRPYRTYLDNGYYWAGTKLPGEKDFTRRPINVVDRLMFLHNHGGPLPRLDTAGPYDPLDSAEVGLTLECRALPTDGYWFVAVRYPGVSMAVTEVVKVEGHYVYLPGVEGKIFRKLLGLHWSPVPADPALQQAVDTQTLVNGMPAIAPLPAKTPNLLKLSTGPASL